MAKNASKKPKRKGPDTSLRIGEPRLTELRKLANDYEGGSLGGLIKTVMYEFLAAHLPTDEAKRIGIGKHRFLPLLHMAMRKDRAKGLEGSDQDGLNGPVVAKGGSN